MLPIVKLWFRLSDSLLGRFLGENVSEKTHCRCCCCEPSSDKQNSVNSKNKVIKTKISKPLKKAENSSTPLQPKP